MIISGQIIEIINYENGYLKGYENKNANTGRKKEESENYQEHRKQVLQRAKTDVRRLINSNVGLNEGNITEKFLTLTFAENVTDLDQANYEFKKFIARLNYKVTGEKKTTLKYITVVEFQKRGAIHYHTIIFNMPYIKHRDLQELWSNGHLKVNKIKHVDNLGAYITKYMNDPNKDQGRQEEDNRLKGRKSYFTSRGLNKPIENTKKQEIDTIAAALPQDKIVYKAHFENEYQGAISYTQYNMNSKRIKL